MVKSLLTDAPRAEILLCCGRSLPATIRMIRNIRISGRHTQCLRQARRPLLEYHTSSPMAEHSSSGCCRTRPSTAGSGAAAAARSLPVDSLAQHHIQRSESVHLYAHAEDSTVARAAEDMPSLMRYHPTPWLPGRHAQTVFASNRPLPQPGLQLRRQTVTYTDGGVGAIDWVQPGPDPAAAASRGHACVLLLHGLMGGSHEPYVQHAAAELTQAGFLCGIMIARGCCRLPLATPRAFSGAATDDLAEVVPRAQAAATAAAPAGAPTPRLMLVGFSLGAGVTLKYMAAGGRGVHAAAAVCPALDFVAACRQLEGTFMGKHVYSRVLSGGLVDYMGKHESMTKQVPGADLPGALAATTVRQLDTAMIVPMFGYQDVWDYYHDASTGKELHAITKPTLVLLARNDPICTVPDAMPRLSEHVLVACAASGGHLGFPTGWSAHGASWADRTLAEWFCRAAEAAVAVPPSSSSSS